MTQGTGKFVDSQSCVEPSSVFSVSLEPPPHTLHLHQGFCSFVWSLTLHPGLWVCLRGLVIPRTVPEAEVGSLSVLHTHPPLTSFLAFCCLPTPSFFPILPPFSSSSLLLGSVPFSKSTQMGWAGRLVQPQPRPALTLSPWALAGPGIRDPAAWCPPLPAAPIFSLGLIGCQDLPNVSSSIRVFKRAPEAIFKRGGWGQR